MTGFRRLFVGDVFGMLTIVKELPGIITATSNKSGMRHFLAKCECGVYTKVRHSELVSGKTNSCGCLRRKKSKERKVTHGLSKCRLYSVYRAIVSRCTKSNDPGYKNYGGRGISCERANVCDFIEDMGPSYVTHVDEFGIRDTTIERINNNGNYCRENCRRATRQEQNLNKRNSVKYKGKAIIEWAKELGIAKAVLYARVGHLKWTFEKAISTPYLGKHGKLRRIGKKIK